MRFTIQSNLIGAVAPPASVVIVVAGAVLSLAVAWLGNRLAARLGAGGG